MRETMMQLPLIAWMTIAILNRRTRVRRALLKGGSSASWRPHLMHQSEVKCVLQHLMARPCIYLTTNGSCQATRE